MTLSETLTELHALDLDEECIAIVISELDTARLQILASAINIELDERYDGKPLMRASLH